MAKILIVDADASFGFMIESRFADGLVYVESGTIAGLALEAL